MYKSFLVKDFFGRKQKFIKLEKKNMYKHIVIRSGLILINNFFNAEPLK